MLELLARSWFIQAANGATPQTQTAPASPTVPAGLPSVGELGAVFVVGVLCLWGLIAILRRLRPPVDALLIAPIGRPRLFQLAVKGGAHPGPPAAVGDAQERVAQWGVIEFAFAFAVYLFLVVVVSRHLAEEPLAVRLIGVSAVNLVVTVAILVFIRFLHEQNPLSFLLAAGSEQWLWLKTLLISVAGYGTVAFLVGPLWQLLLAGLNTPSPKQELVQILQDSPSTELWRAMVIATVIAAPLFEEVLYRGILYIGLRKLIGVPGGAVVSGFVFALIHFNLYSFLPLFALGVILALAYERTRNLLVPIFFHAAFNGLTLLLVYYGLVA